MPTPWHVLPTLRAVAVIDELVPAGDAELDGQRLEELSGRLATMRPFLPILMRCLGQRDIGLGADQGWSGTSYAACHGRWWPSMEGRCPK